MALPSVKTIQSSFAGMTKPDAEAVHAAMSSSVSAQSAEDAMGTINKIITGHGVESLYDPKKDDGRGFWGSTVALYVNVGDLYIDTVVYYPETNRFAVESLAEVIENFEERNRKVRRSP